MEFLAKVPWKKVIKIASTVASAGMAVFGVLSDKKFEMEWEQMKRDVENLKNSQ